MNQWFKKRVFVRAVSVMMFFVFSMVTVLPAASVFAAEGDAIPPVVEGETSTPETTPPTVEPEETVVPKAPEETLTSEEPAEGDFVVRDPAKAETATFDTAFMLAPPVANTVANPMVNVTTVSIHDEQTIYAWLDDKSTDSLECEITVDQTGAKTGYKDLLKINDDGVATSIVETLKKNEPLALNLAMDWSKSTIEEADRVDALLGRVTITAINTDKDNKETKKTVSFNVNYKAETSEITSLTVSPTAVTLAVGDSTVIKPSIGPDKATEINLNWELVKGDSVTVTDDGRIVAVRGGTSTISVTPVTHTAVEGKDAPSATVTVTVYEDMDPKNPVWLKPAIKDEAVPTTIKSETVGTGITTITSEGLLGGKSVILDLGAVEGAERSNREKITWSIDPKAADKSVATIEADTGKLTLKKVGVTTILVKGSTSKAEKRIVLTVGEVVVDSITITLLSEMESGADTPSDPTDDVYKDAPDTLTLGKGFTIALGSKVLPAHATDAKVTWKSDATSGATVSSTGVVRGIRAGKVATITATAGGKTDTIVITVAEPKLIPGVAFYESDKDGVQGAVISTSVTAPLILEAGKDTKILAVLTGISNDDKYITNPNVIWKLSQSGVATLSVVPKIDDKKLPVPNEFIVTLKGSTSTTKAGEVIRAVASNVEDYPSIYIKLNPIPPTDVEITNVPKIVEINKQSRALKVKLTPTNGHKVVEWSIPTAEQGIATIDKNTGVITGIAKGEVHVTATATEIQSNGVYASDTVTVTVGTPLKSAKLNTTSLTLPAGEKYQLAVALTPYTLNAEKDITYESRNPYIADVDSNGLITVDPQAMNKEFTTIDVIVGDDEKKLSCKVTVSVADRLDITGVTATSLVHKMNVGSSKKMPYKLLPTTKALPSNVTWSSADQAVAYVDQLGNVTAVGSTDTAETTVTGIFTDAKGGTYPVVYTIQISPTLMVAGVDGIYNKRLQITLKEGETATVTADVRPSDKQEIVWRTTSKYADISSTGGDSIVITANDLAGRTSGTASITVRDNLTKKSATISVKIIKK